jgi:hypothetical protein
LTGTQNEQKPTFSLVKWAFLCNYLRLRQISLTPPALNHLTFEQRQLPFGFAEMTGCSLVGMEKKILPKAKKSATHMRFVALFVLKRNT